jgi:hypothetical protein
MPHLQDEEAAPHAYPNQYDFGSTVGCRELMMLVIDGCLKTQLQQTQ